MPTTGPDPLVVYKGPTSKGRGWEEKGRKGGGVDGKGTVLWSPKHP